MKRLVLLSLSLFIVSICRAQYSYYDPLLTAALVNENAEIQKLNNIRFDSKAIAENPAAFNEYMAFLDRDEIYSKKRRNWDIVGGVSAGVALAGLIPLFKSSDYGFDDPKREQLEKTSMYMMGGGLLGMLIGYAGRSSFNKKMVINKKDFIFYLKTTNNGIGIVTIF